MGKILMTCVAALALAGCSGDSGFIGSPHGYSGTINTVWADVNGVPTIIQDGESALQSDYGLDGKMRDMPSTYEVDRAGNVRATGVAAYIMALADFCNRAPQAKFCSKEALPIGGGR